MQIHAAEDTGEISVSFQSRVMTQQPKAKDATSVSESESWIKLSSFFFFYFFLLAGGDVFVLPFFAIICFLESKYWSQGERKKERKVLYSAVLRVVLGLYKELLKKPFVLGGCSDS